MSEDDKMQLVELSPAQVKARRGRNIAIALICGGLVVMFYIVSLVKFPQILNAGM